MKRLTISMSDELFEKLDRVENKSLFIRRLIERELESEPFPDTDNGQWVHDITQLKGNVDELFQKLSEIEHHLIDKVGVDALGALLSGKKEEVSKDRTNPVPHGEGTCIVTSIVPDVPVAQHTEPPVRAIESLPDAQQAVVSPTMFDGIAPQAQGPETDMPISINGPSVVSSPVMPEFNAVATTVASKPVMPEFNSATSSFESKPVMPEFNSATPSFESKPVMSEFNSAAPSFESKPMMPEFNAVAPPVASKPVMPEFNAVTPPVASKPVMPEFNAVTPPVASKPVMPEFNAVAPPFESKPVMPEFNAVAPPVASKPVMPEFNAVAPPVASKPVMPEFNAVAPPVASKPVMPEFNLGKDTPSDGNTPIFKLHEMPDMAMVDKVAPFIAPSMPENTSGAGNMQMPFMGNQRNDNASGKQKQNNAKPGKLEGNILMYMPRGAKVKKAIIKSLVSKQFSDAEIDSKLNEMLSSGVLSMDNDNGEQYLVRR